MDEKPSPWLTNHDFVVEENNKQWVMLTHLNVYKMHIIGVMDI